MQIATSYAQGISRTARPSRATPSGPGRQAEPPVQLGLPEVPAVRIPADFACDQPSLTPISRHALATQVNQARENHQAAFPDLLERVRQLGFEQSDLEQALAFLDQQAPLTINLPPSISCEGGQESIFASLQEDGIYKNLWERGSRPSHPKAPRRSKADFLFKEHNTFAGTYNQAAPEERPHYGALNFLLAPEGGAAVYGPGVLILDNKVKQRTSFHPRDSRFTRMENAGAMEAMAGCLLSKTDDDLKQLLEVATGRRPHGQYGPDGHPQAFTGSNYIEAQIHGPVDLSEDLAGVALHRKYQGTPSGADAEAMARQFDVPLTWYDDAALLVNTDGFIVR